MSRPLVPYAFWTVVELLLPPELPKPRGGLAVRLTGANMHDSVMPEEVVDAVPPLQQPEAAPASDPASCMPTRPTITTAAAGP